MALVAMLAVSCGGKSESTSVTVTADDSVCGGSLGEYVTLKTGDYTVMCKDDRLSVTATFEVKAIPSDKKAPYYPETKLILLDENKSPLGIEIEVDIMDKHEMSTALQSGSAKLSLKFEEYVSDAMELLAKAKYVEASVSGELENPSKSSSSSDDAEASSSDDSESEEVASASSSNTDIDAWLDKYDKLMTTYVSLAKKAQSGDISALAEYTSYVSQLTDLYDELESVKDEMTAAQAARLSKIYAKMATAAM